MDTFLAFINSLAGLVPVVAFGVPLIAIIVDAAKAGGKGLPDGYAPLVAGLLNVGLYAVVYFAGPDNTVKVQNVVQGLTLIAPVVLGAVMTAIGAAKLHTVLKPVGFGFSHADTTPA